MHMCMREREGERARDEEDEDWSWVGMTESVWRAVNVCHSYQFRPKGSVFSGSKEICVICRTVVFRIVSRVLLPW